MFESEIINFFGSETSPGKSSFRVDKDRGPF